ncbi:hypothetical protein K2X33_07935, partial [bacterium]|nr:hypothetical protein [bacterium]
MRNAIAASIFGLSLLAMQHSEPQPSFSFRLDLAFDLALSASRSDALIEVAAKYGGVFVVGCSAEPRIAYKIFDPGTGNIRWMNQRVPADWIHVRVKDYEADIRLSGVLAGTGPTPNRTLSLYFPNEDLETLPKALHIEMADPVGMG